MKIGSSMSSSITNKSISDLTRRVGSEGQRCTNLARLSCRSCFRLQNRVVIHGPVSTFPKKSKDLQMPHNMNIF